MEIRRLNRDLMGVAALVHRRAFDERLPWLSGLHTPDDDLRYFRDHVFCDCAVWGAFDEQDLIGFIAFREGWIDQLYVLPTSQGRGAGSALLNLAKASGGELQLWTFQKNGPSRAFYESHGFRLVEETDGARNQEQEPDVRYVWGSRPGAQ